MSLICLDKSTLKPGDTVGIAYNINLGWKTFRYDRIVPEVIKRITPARTKFIMKSGREYSRSITFYAITEETEHRTKVVNCAENINRAIFKLDRMDDLYKKDDETLIKVSAMLDEMMKVLQEASHA